MWKRRVLTSLLTLLICVEMDGIGGDGFDGDGDMLRGHPSACLFVARFTPPPPNSVLTVVSIP